MQERLISVIIPVYNVAPYLDRCLTSVLNSTHSNLEVICVNDGSTDNSLEILNAYAARDCRIQVISQNNQGLSVARNTAIDQAAGDYLFYLDSDDWVHQQAFEFLLRAAEASNADIVLGGHKNIADYYGFTPDPDYSFSFDGKIYTAEAFIDSSGYARDVVWGTLYRRDSVMHCRFPVGKTYGEDAYYNTFIISGENEIRFAVLNFPIYYYYLTRPNSIMKGANANVQLSNIKWWIQNIEMFEYKQHALSIIFRYAFMYRYEGLCCSNPKIARKNFRTCIKCILPYFWHCKKMSTKKIIRNLLIAFVPEVYRKIITAKDPSYKYWDVSAKDNLKTFILKEWHEV